MPTYPSRCCQWFRVADRHDSLHFVSSVSFNRTTGSLALWSHTPFFFFRIKACCHVFYSSGMVSIWRLCLQVQILNLTTALQLRHSGLSILLVFTRWPSFLVARFVHVGLWRESVQLPGFCQFLRMASYCGFNNLALVSLPLHRSKTSQTL